MTTGLVVLKMVLMPSRQRRPSRANSGPRWSMIGVSMARRMRSGSGVGPGIWRKWRPAVRDEFFDMMNLQTLEGNLDSRRSLPVLGRIAERSEVGWGECTQEKPHPAREGAPRKSEGRGLPP